MLAAVLTVCLFALSGVAGERSARAFGGQQANLLRLLFACLVMGAVTLIWFPASIQPHTFAWLFASGVVGFGFGDIALFLAYVRIGARLTILLNLCTAPLWSALLEKLWLGTTLGSLQILAGGIILAGVAAALLARPSKTHTHGSRAIGILCGLLAGCGQGLGAVISRKAFELAEISQFELNGFSAAAQRVTGGFCTALTLLLILHLLGKSHSRPVQTVPPRKAWSWLAATTLCGPILGVTCFQWSLSELPAGITTAVIATTPVAMIPLTMWLDKERPSLLSILGSMTAVGGVILMIFAN